MPATKLSEVEEIAFAAITPIGGAAVTEAGTDRGNEGIKIRSEKPIGPRRQSERSPVAPQLDRHDEMPRYAQL